MAETLYWNSGNAGPELAAALKALAEEYPLAEGAGTPSLAFTPGRTQGEVTVTRSGGVYGISYGTQADALRGVGAALAGIVAEGKTLSEARPFTTFGIMLDCSRNAVMKPSHVRTWLRRLALFGYNMVMLYTEDTYRIPGRPYFGFLRGAYSAQELKDLDAYAAGLGIEMIGCIQTLGHLEQILKWPAFSNVKDTGGVMLAGEPATYDLVKEMVEVFAGSFRSRRIHVGMDEAWDIGRGQYINRFGYRREFEIFNEHLARVIEICSAAGLKPLIWSDMYFRLGSRTGSYYDLESVIPDDVRAMIPSGVQLVYWDYYHENESDYLGMIERHRDLGHEPVMGSGVWTWAKLWYDRFTTEKAAAACVRACRSAGLKELFFTLWGDDGAYCEFDSALAGLALTAEISYGGAAGNRLKKRFAAACGAEYDHVLAGCLLEDPTLGGRLQEGAAGPAAQILWDDPLLGIWHNTRKGRDAGFWKLAQEHYDETARKLRRRRRTTSPFDFGHAAQLAEFLAARISLRIALEEAYSSRDRSALAAVAASAKKTAKLAEKTADTFRRQWLARNKPFGLEVIQARMGALRARLLEVAERSAALAEGRIDSIPELDEAAAVPPEAFAKSGVHNRFQRLITPSSIL
ncbi:MAG: family 20 glycosylhydrolase [Planctomycetes bacterium]|nr:family 20 glycosylhydrolase [Planctomycetota bacterium]